MCNKRANADQKLRDRYEYLMSVRLEENSRMRAARESGAEDHARKMALKMHRQGATSAEIADFVEFPETTVSTWIQQE